LRRELTGLLTERIYPALERNAFYVSFLARAGLTARQTAAPASARAALANAARAEAARIVQTCMPFGHDQVLCGALLRGPMQLFGLGDVWCAEALHQIAKREAPGEETRWLATWLGISRDGPSTAELTAKFLPGGALMPAIQVQGLPLRQFGRHSWRSPRIPQYRYWPAIDRQADVSWRYLLPYP
jgi:hypothetical protein